MGLLELLTKLKEKPKALRVLILGLGNSGKTSFLKSCSGEDPSKTTPTLGFNVKSKQHITHDLCFWDIGGQDNLQQYWDNFFPETDGIIWVIDSTDRENLPKSKALLQKTISNPSLNSVPVLILCSKQDLPGCVSISEIKDYFELSSLQCHWAVLKYSSQIGEGLNSCLDWICYNILYTKSKSTQGI